MSLIRYDLDGGAARIILTAPDRGNPLDPDMAAELFRAVRQARADDARVVVLRSEGRAFSFGGDVGAFATADDREQMVDDLAETLHRTISDLHRMDAVVVSAVQGMAAAPACRWPRPPTWFWRAPRRASRSPTPRSGCHLTAAARCSPRRSGCTARCTWRCSTPSLPLSRRRPRVWSQRSIPTTSSTPRSTLLSPSCSPGRAPRRSPPNGCSAKPPRPGLRARCAARRCPSAPAPPAQTVARAWTHSPASVRLPFPSAKH